MAQSLQAQMALTQSEPMLGRPRSSRSSYLTVKFAHGCLIVLFFCNVFVTAVFHHGTVDYVVHARYWPSPLRMAQSLRA